MPKQELDFLKKALELELSIANRQGDFATTRKELLELYLTTNFLAPKYRNLVAVQYIYDICNTMSEIDNLTSESDSDTNINGAIKMYEHDLQSLGEAKIKEQQNTKRAKDKRQKAGKKKSPHYQK
jgi:hypothetical protein